MRAGYRLEWIERGVVETQPVTESGRIAALSYYRGFRDGGRHAGLQLWHGSTLLAGTPRVWRPRAQPALRLEEGE